MIKNLSKFEKALHIEIKKKTLLIEALTHKSSDLKNNNEKLEFLGDRVIGLVLSQKLYDLYPEVTEGILDKRFAKLVNRKTCATVGWAIGINDYIILGDQNKKIKKNDEKILSDACEAIIGAVYVDRGFTYVQELVLRLWDSYIKKSNITILDSKTKLQEHSLKIYKQLPVYRFISSKGPKHNPIFKFSVSIKNSKLVNGQGNSKQKAEQNAADNLLKNLKGK